MTNGEELSRTVIYVSASALIWLFGVLVFLPVAEEIDPEGLTVLITLIIFLSYSLFLIRGFKGIRQAIDTASSIFTEKYAQAREGSMNKMRKRMKTALEAVILAVIYLFYSPLLSRFHPSINGIALIMTLLGILWTLLKEV